jgi:hypothetical protein
MKGVVRYDDYLTKLSLAYPTGNLIGNMVAPVISAENYSDYVFTDADDAIQQVNDNAEATGSNGVDFSVGDPYSYRTIRRALHHIIKDKELNNSKKNSVVRAEQRITNKLTHRLRLKHEMRVQSILRDTSKVTNYKNVDSVATKRWDETAPDLEGDIITAVKSINDNTGVAANTIIIPFQAALYAANMSFVKDTLKYQYGMEVVTSQFQRQVMALVGLPPVIKGLKVMISNGRVQDNNKGETASVTNPWGKDCLIGYVPPNPGIDSMFGIMTMEYDGFKVSKERVSDPNGTKIIAEWDYDVLEANLDCWYLLQNVIG